ncbi:MAG: enoyl-CoA hydratase/isomerase family protein [Flavobacteriales bacterium]|nr:enoyl-CoA hydratase/isomerase family protein [Flavobacteriales bacterium]
MPYKNITLQSENNITLVTINRPDKLNALNIETIDELHRAFLETENDQNCKVIILTGSGNKAFVAGADISEFYKFTVEQGKQLSADGHTKLFNLIEDLSKPVIAAINGFALGGGLELAMSCHIRVASNNAKMGLPEVSLGVIPGYGGTQRLPQLVGKGKAMEMIFTAQMITAQDALNCKLVNYVTSSEELLNQCKEIATQICKNSPTAISAAVRSINAGFAGNNGLNTEIEEFGKCFGTADFKEGTLAFLEKRKPQFTGC